MTLYFHGDDDLTEIRPDIFSYGYTDFENQMQESEDIISRTIESKWYRTRAEEVGVDWRSTEFDRTLLLEASTQLRRVASYKSLELIYLFLMKEAPEPDAFERQMNTFKKLYNEEIQEVLDSGLDYDWDESGGIDPGENKLPRIRRLHRV